MNSSSICASTPSTRSSIAWCASTRSSTPSPSNACRPARSRIKATSRRSSSSTSRRSSRGVKPIVGADVWVAESREDREPSRLTLLCQNRAGFKRLSALLTKSAVQGPVGGRNVVLKDWLEPAALDGLDRLVGRAARRARQGARGGPRHARLGGARLLAEAACRAASTSSCNGSAAPASASTSRAPSRPRPRTPCPSSRRTTCASSTRGDFEAHETRVCIAPGRHARRSRARAHATARSSICARRPRWPSCSRICPRRSRTPSRSRSAARSRSTSARCSCRTSSPRTARRRASFSSSARRAGSTQRLRRARRRGRSACRAIASASRARSRSSARWASRATSSSSPTSSPGRARNAIPVGPGRGSGVGSLVAYALGITNLDPLAHDLLFERFLNPERVSLPDFDIDFCIDGRDRVIDYVGQRYGRERVAQIATYGTMAARAVVRDVGRALGHAVRLRRSHREADPVRDRHHARQGDRRRRGAARRLRERRGGARAHRSRASASRGSRATSARMPAAS